MAASAAAALGGCAGSGGGGGSMPPFGSAVPFTQFSAIAANQQVAMQGMSTVVTGTNTGATINTVSSPSTDTSSTTARLGYDGSRALSAVSILTPASISFSKAAGDSFACASGTCTLKNAAGTAQMIVIDPVTLPLGWNFQTFGVWDRTTTTTAFDAGAFSLGNATPGAAIPTVGTATFTGLANGFVATTGGQAFFTTATMTANANFGTQSIAFSTTNTQTVSLTNGVTGAAPQFNLTGTFTYIPGNNLFAGALATPGNAMTGTGTGRFFGPQAQEIGGNYNLSGGGSSMIGAFGGKR